MKKYDIPAGFYEIFDNRNEAVKYIRKQGAPIVVKADGLAAGKGVIVCKTIEEAIQSVDKIMVDKIFGEAGNRVIIEEYLTGEEASYIAFTDGKKSFPWRPPRIISLYLMAIRVSTQVAWEPTHQHPS